MVQRLLLKMVCTVFGKEEQLALPEPVQMDLQWFRYASAAVGSSAVCLTGVTVLFFFDMRDAGELKF